MAGERAPHQPTLESLREFLYGLGWRLSPDQIAAAEKILLLTWTEEPNERSFSALKTGLAPICAKNLEQQAEFYAAYDRFFDRPVAKSKVVPQLGGRELVKRGRPYPFIIVAVCLLLAVAATAF